MTPPTPPRSRTLAGSLPARLGALLLILLAAPAALADPDDSWSPDFGWPPGGLGLDSFAYALETYDGELVVGGSFFEAGPLTGCGRIAKFDGDAWTGRMKRGMDDVVTALGRWNGDLYAGGTFLTANLLNPVAARRVARWDGTSWTALGDGVNDNPRAFAEHGGSLIAGGYFTEAGGAPALRVAAWDGASWSALGTGLGETALTTTRVVALASWGGHLYAGGTFTEIDGTPVTGLARWDGASWSDFGTTITPGGSFFGGIVSALCADWGPGLVVGGNLAAINGTPVNGIALWDGATWTDLGAGLDAGATVRDLVVYHGDLIAIGGGLSLGSGSSFGVARWDGVSWEPLGSGFLTWDLFSDQAYGAVLDGELYVGGNIGTAGGTTAAFLARWTDVGTGAFETVAVGPPRLAARPNPARDGTIVTWSLGRAATVDLAVYDAAGRLVTRLASGPRAAGIHHEPWSGRDASGAPRASGVYFVRLVTDERTETARVVVTR
jgi:hypothetical protein